MAVEALAGDVATFGVVVGTVQNSCTKVLCKRRKKLTKFHCILFTNS